MSIEFQALVLAQQRRIAELERERAENAPLLSWIKDTQPNISFAQGVLNVICNRTSIMLWVEDGFLRLYAIQGVKETFARSHVIDHVEFKQNPQTCCIRCEFPPGRLLFEIGAVGSVSLGGGGEHRTFCVCILPLQEEICDPLITTTRYSTSLTCNISETLREAADAWSIRKVVD